MRGRMNRFEILNIDYDCGLTNPWISIPLFIVAIAHGALLILVLQARVPRRIQVIWFLIVLAVGWPLSIVISYIPFTINTYLSFRREQHFPQIGCMGSPPAYLRPAIATTTAAVVYLLQLVFTRQAQSSSSGT
jgi:hypothetical protein